MAHEASTNRMPHDTEEDHVAAAVQRLEDQIDWYDRKSRTNQHTFMWLKGAEMAAAGLIPLSAVLGLPGAAAASLGVLITLLEGSLQLGQHQHNWVIYRSTCEALKHEKFLFKAGAGPYALIDRPHALLAERVESILARETGRWLSERSRRGKAPVTDREA